METGGFATGMLGILGLSGGELALVLILILILFGANRIPPFARGLGEGFNGFRRSSRGLSQEIGESLGAGLGKPVADALTHSNQTWEFQDPPALRLRSIKKQMKNNFILWIAQGFGVGRIPFAAGTFGSLVGLLWFVVLLLPGNVQRPHRHANPRLDEFHRPGRHRIPPPYQVRAASVSPVLENPVLPDQLVVAARGTLCAT